MRAERLRDIGTAAPDLDHRGEDVACPAAGSTELRGNAQSQHTRVADCFDGVVLQHPFAFGRGIVAPQRCHDLGKPGQSIVDRPTKWPGGERLSRGELLRV